MISHERLHSILGHYVPRTYLDPEFTRAAVLVPVFEKDGVLQFLFTVRTEDVEHHKGQISFPGGAMESEDFTVEDTALRESREEIALPEQSVKLLGRIDDLWTPTGFVVSPVVGYIETLPRLRPQPQEVSEVFTAPLTYFMDDSNGYTKTYRRGDTESEVWFYEFSEYTIWGVTAFIIRNLKYILEHHSNSSG